MNINDFIQSRIDYWTENSLKYNGGVCKRVSGNAQMLLLHELHLIQNELNKGKE